MSAQASPLDRSSEIPSSALLLAAAPLPTGAPQPDATPQDAAAPNAAAALPSGAAKSEANDFEATATPDLAAEPPEPIALFGTSADPPTHGHRALLEQLLALYPRVATWASDNPLKQHTAPLELRTALLGALVEAIGDPRLSLEQQLSSPWAMETLERAQRHWPRRQPVFVIGSDLAPQVPRWRGAAQWLQGCRLAIAPRQGWPLEDGALERLRQLGALPEVLAVQIPASASSGVRASPVPAQVPAELLPLLRRHDPYGLLTPRCASPSPSSTS